MSLKAFRTTVPFLRTWRFWHDTWSKSDDLIESCSFSCRNNVCKKKTYPGVSSVEIKFPKFNDDRTSCKFYTYDAVKLALTKLVENMSDCTHKIRKLFLALLVYRFTQSEFHKSQLTQIIKGAKSKFHFTLASLLTIHIFVLDIKAISNTHN